MQVAHGCHPRKIQQDQVQDARAFRWKTSVPRQASKMSAPAIAIPDIPSSVVMLPPAHGCSPTQGADHSRVPGVGGTCRGFLPPSFLHKRGVQWGSNIDRLLNSYRFLLRSQPSTSTTKLECLSICQLARRSGLQSASHATIWGTFYELRLLTGTSTLSAVAGGETKFTCCEWQPKNVSRWQGVGEGKIINQPVSTLEFLS